MLVSKETILTYKNERGLSIKLAPLTNFCLLSCVESISNNINSQKSRYLDGETFDNSTMGARHIEITGFFNTVTNRRQMDRTLKRVFHMGLDGELTYTRQNSNDVFTINCRVESLPEIIFNNNTVEFTINLVCFNPFWRGESKTENISLINKLGKFPLIIPASGFVFGYRTKTFESTFDNTGDVVTGAVYTLTANGGTVSNPSITHENTSRILKIIYTLQDSEKIVITSQPGYVGVLIHKANGSIINGMPYLTDENNRLFFMLDFGENTIGYNADINATNLSVSVTYETLFLEVF